MRNYLILLSLVLLLLSFGCIGGGQDTEMKSTTSQLTTSIPGAVKDLKTNWEEEMVYQHPLVYPSYLTLDGEGNIFIASRGNNKIIKLLTTGKFSTYADISSLSRVFSIGYQPGLGRLLIGTSQTALYGFSNGEMTTLKNSGIYASSIAVNNLDDTFYTCSQGRNSKIIHYGVNGKRISTLVTGVDGCFQLALDETNNILYYSETFAGRITELDLSDKSRKVIATGVGIPGTFEPIAIALNGENTLYSFAALEQWSSSLNKYEGGSFTKVMDSISGAGPMIWSSAHSAFLVGNGVGANIVSYNPSTARAEYLTQYVNALGIVETDDGTVLVCDGEQLGGSILSVSSSGFTPFTEDLGEGYCSHLERDFDGNIYAGMTDGSILKITKDGSATSWASGYSNLPIVSLHYDSKNNAMISFTANPETSRTTIWRIYLDSPKKATKVMELSNTLIHGSLPTGAVDNSGNIYVLERKANVIYKIQNDASTATIFASNVLDNDAITVPRMEYLSKEDALLVSTIENYELWPLNNPVKSTFATNNGGVDNFGINENKNGDLIAIHSGQVFRLVFR